MNILLVEPQLFMRRLLLDVLSQFGARNVDTADNIETAYQMFQGEPYDLVITDWSPALNGAALTHRMRTASDSSNWFVPVIMVSAYTEIRRVYAARDTGITEFLAKPVTAHLLYRRVCSVITNYRMFVRCNSFFGPDRRRRRLPLNLPCRREGGNVNHANRRKDQVPFDHNERRQGYPGFAHVNDVRGVGRDASAAAPVDAAADDVVFLG